MSQLLTPEVLREMRLATAGLPLYKDGPGVDFNRSAVAYVLNITIMRDPLLRKDTQGIYKVSRDTDILLVQHGSSDGRAGSWSGISGYVDSLYNPRNKDDISFDPLLYTALKKLAQKCSIKVEALKKFEFFLGESFSESKPYGRTMVVFPLMAIYNQGEVPLIVPDGKEITACKWVPLHYIADTRNLSKGYLSPTLPSALKGLGVQQATFELLTGI